MVPVNPPWCTGFPAAAGSPVGACLMLASWGLVRWLHDERRPPIAPQGVPHGTQAPP